MSRTRQLCAEKHRLTRRNARWGCACCPADLSAVAESPAKFEARPLSSRGSLWVWTSTQPGVASRPSESISRLLGPALPPTCVIKPLSIGYYPRKPRHRATNGGLVHPGSPARFPPGPHGPVRHDVQSLAVHDSLPQPHSAGFSCRGTIGSNPSSSSGESCELRYRHRRPACLFGCGGRQVNMVVAGTERRYALAKENPMELSRIIASGTIGHSLAGGELSAISLIRLTNGPNRRFGIGTPSASRCRHPSDIDRVRTVQARNP